MIWREKMSKKEKMLANFAYTLQAFMRESSSTFQEISDALIKLSRYEGILSRYNSLHSMQELTRTQKRKEGVTRSKVKNIVKSLGFDVKFNNDPRGYAIRVILPSKSSNNWDGETWVINF